MLPSDVLRLRKEYQHHTGALTGIPSKSGTSPPLLQALVEFCLSPLVVVERVLGLPLLKLGG